MKSVGKLCYDSKNPIGRGQCGTYVFSGFFQKRVFGKKLPVAVKRIQKGSAADKSFQKEVKAMEKACSKFPHPYILGYICTEKNKSFL